MAPNEAETLLKNLDRRVERVEQILPTLATRNELHAAIAPLATKEELRAAIAPLATREELLATKEDLQAEIARVDARISEEGERTRRHFDVVVERMRDDIKVVAEGHAALERRATHVDGILKDHDRRLDRLETSAGASRRARKR
jgi:hypothetical protein